VIPAIVLAAGAATRFGGPKQTLLLPHVLERLRRSPVDGIVVVAGAYEVEADTRVVDCPEWELGPGSSLRCGLGALPPEAEAAVVVLADGPNLSPAAVERVIGVWRAGAGRMVAASYAAQRGHPVVLGRDSWSDIPDEGLRGLPVTLVPCDDLGTPGDVDAADDISRLRPPLAEI
jgi:nicotine blue oxidoreductase